jgi:Fe2+ or Zn2+ uptake regulation protein
MPAARETAEIVRQLRERGLRATAPRREVLRFLRSHGQHLTAADIFTRLRRARRPVSIATLYQNLQTLSAHGLLKRFAGPDGLMRYDINPSAHHHLVCERCGRITDVEISDEQAVRPVLPKGAGSQGSQGWRVRLRHVEFRGVCPDCRAAGRTRATRLS